jgi:hypothetical protein
MAVRLEIGPTDSQYLDDLHRAFYQRLPDAGDKAFWQQQLDGGMNREGVILGFMFSAEFNAYMDAVLGAFTQRPETALTMDVYRAALTRFPDSGGFDYWRGTLRTAQCNGTVDSAARIFINYTFQGPEYVNRARSTRQFVADLYDVFFRRGPDLGGFNFWVGWIDSGNSRQAAIDAWYAGAEWQDRVSAITAAGCVQ